MTAKKLVQCFAVMAALVVSALSANAQNAQTRAGFWFSGGLGVGSLGCDACSSRANGLSGDLSIGGTINPRFLIGVGTSGWTKTEQTTTLTVATLDARVRFYPSTNGGFFLTGGAGVADATANVGAFNGGSEVGLGLLLGVGYDIRLARNASITPYWNGFTMRNSRTDANVGQVGLAITLH